MSKLPPPSEATTEYLREQLITADFHGQDYKRRCLEELLDREYASALRHQEST